MIAQDQWSCLRIIQFSMEFMSTKVIVLREEANIGRACN